MYFILLWRSHSLYQEESWCLGHLSLSPSLSHTMTYQINRRGVSLTGETLTDEVTGMSNSGVAISKSFMQQIPAVVDCQICQRSIIRKGGIIYAYNEILCLKYNQKHYISLSHETRFNTKCIVCYKINKKSMIRQKQKIGKIPFFMRSIWICVWLLLSWKMCLLFAKTWVVLLLLATGSNAIFG